MSDLLEISDQVMAYLAPEDLAGLARARQHTELKCFACEGSIPPESKEKTTVSLVSDPIEKVLVARVAHSACAPSEVNVRDMPREAMAITGSGSISYVQAVLRLSGPIAAIFWEPNLSVMVRDEAGSTIYPYIEHYRALGFVSEEVFPTLDGWDFRVVEESNLVLWQEEEKREQFDAAMQNAPDGWLATVKRTGSCLAVVAVGLGVDRFDLAEFQKAREEGRSVGAVISV